MILEHVELRIEPAQQVAFESAIARAMHTVTSQAAGMRCYRLDRCHEDPGLYVMQITWNSLEDHMVVYRQGPLSPQFRALVESYFAQPPVMRHFHTVVRSS